MKGSGFSVLLSSLLVCLVLQGCASDSSRQTSGPSQSLDAFKADRPQAGELLRQHPGLEEWLRDAWGSSIEGYHIQWSNEKPTHGPGADTAMLPEDRLMVIHISDKYAPPDQLVALCFETCNAQAHSRFEALCSKATSGAISRGEFVEAVGQVEYGAVLRVKDCIPRLLPLSSNQVSAAILYRSLLEVPTDFEAYKEWSRSHSENYRLSDELAGRQYDELRKASSKQ